jgi:predicted transcriptional regulator
VNNRRSEFEIISKILDISKYGAKKTEILYKGNFSHTQLTSYLTFLINKDILEEKTKNENGQNCKYYIITEKGIDLLGDINKTLSHLKK